METEQLNVYEIAERHMDEYNEELEDQILAIERAIEGVED